MNPKKISLIDEHLLEREATRRVRPPNILYATDLTHPCLRQIYLNITHDRPHKIQTLRIFNAGRVLEDYWLDLLDRRRGIQVLGTQLPAYYTITLNKDPFDLDSPAVKYEIHGRVDVLAQHDYDGVVVHEVKTAKTTHWMKEPKPEHVQQIQYYLNVLGVKKGVIDYLDKTVFLQGVNPRRPDEEVQIDRSFPIRAERKSFLNTLAQAQKIANCIENAVIPVANPKAWGGRICDYCLYRDLCGKEESDG